MALKWTPDHNKSLVAVFWRDADASAPTDAFYEEEIKHHTRPMVTYGLLVKQDQEGVTVMNEYYREDDGKEVYRGRTFIPGYLVDRIDVIAEPWKRKARARRLSPVPEPNVVHKV